MFMNDLTQSIKAETLAKKVFYKIFQIIWGLPQTLAGFCVFLINRNCPHKTFYGCVCTSWKLKASLSLGMFIFVSDDPLFYYEHERGNYSEDEFYNMLAVHEYGHTIQSLIWGPLYLLVVGATSMIWAKLPYFEKKRAEQKVSYFDAFPENQANRLGEKLTGIKSPGMILSKTT